jgi:phosphoglycolate phosphatase
VTPSVPRSVLQSVQKSNISPDPKAFIFDFDGTIANTLESIVRITNRLAPRYGFSPTTPARLQYLRSLSTQQLLAESEIPLFRIPFVIRQVRKELALEVAQLEPIPQLVAVLQALAQAGHGLMIVSSNSVQTIESFLSQHQLDTLFSDIYANTGLLGKPKVIKRLLQRHQLSAQNVIYVGDETRDIEAAHAAGIAVAAVSWGFSSRSALNNQHPTFLLDYPHQLLTLAASPSLPIARPIAKPDAIAKTPSSSPHAIG